MKVAYCPYCMKTAEQVELFSIPSPSRHYFSICRSDLGRASTLNPQLAGDEILVVRASFADVVDGRTAHTALLGQFPKDAAIRVRNLSNVRNGHAITFNLLVPTDRRCDAAKAIDTFCREWNATVDSITGTRFEFPVDCKDTMELRKRQKFCRDNRDKAKYPALRKDA